MKHIITILLISFLIGCERRSGTYELDESKIADINQIVETLISHDRLLIDKKSLSNSKFCSELRKTIIEVPLKQNDGTIIPPVPNNIYITNLVNDKINGEIFFSSIDSSYILSQNANPEKIKIEKSLLERINTTTIEQEKMNRVNGKKYDYYEMTIPIFSLDRKKAYVELDYRCGTLCGHGKSFYLQKISGKWKVVEEWENWTS